MSRQENQEEVDYAYSVINTFTDACNKALGNIESTDRLTSEIIFKLGSLLEAMMILANNEHKQIIYEFSKAYLRMMREWAVKRR